MARYPVPIPTHIRVYQRPPRQRHDPRPLHPQSVLQHLHHRFFQTHLQHQVVVVAGASAPTFTPTERRGPQSSTRTAPKVSESSFADSHRRSYALYLSTWSHSGRSRLSCMRFHDLHWPMMVRIHENRICHLEASWMDAPNGDAQTAPRNEMEMRRI